MANATRLTDLELSGSLNAGSITGALLGAISISKAADYALSAAEKKAQAVAAAFSAASKALTLDLPSGQIMLVINAGATNAVTVKNLAADTGTSLAAGKVALVIASTTANASGIYVLT